MVVLLLLLLTLVPLVEVAAPTLGPNLLVGPASVLEAVDEGRASHTSEVRDGHAGGDVGIHDGTAGKVPPDGIVLALGGTGTDANDVQPLVFASLAGSGEDVHLVRVHAHLRRVVGVCVVGEHRGDDDLVEAHLSGHRSQTLATVGGVILGEATGEVGGRAGIVQHPRLADDPRLDVRGFLHLHLSDRGRGLHHDVALFVDGLTHHVSLCAGRVRVRVDNEGAVVLLDDHVVGGHEGLGQRTLLFLGPLGPRHVSHLDGATGASECVVVRHLNHIGGVTADGGRVDAQQVRHLDDAWTALFKRLARVRAHALLFARFLVDLRLHGGSGLAAGTQLSLGDGQARLGVERHGHVTPLLRGVPAGQVSKRSLWQCRVDL